MNASAACTASAAAAPAWPTLSWLLVVGLAALLWVLMAYVDRPVAQWALANYHDSPWVELRWILKYTGKAFIHGLFICILLIVGLVSRNRRLIVLAAWLVVLYLLVTVAVSGMKRVVRQPRPAAMDAPRPPLWDQVTSSHWRGCPSGDVAATAGLVTVLWGLMGRPRRWRWLLALPALAAMQRLVAAAHTPSDVLIGWLLGLWLGLLVLRWAAAWQTRGTCPALCGSRPGEA